MGLVQTGCDAASPAQRCKVSAPGGRPRRMLLRPLQGAFVCCIPAVAPCGSREEAGRPSHWIAQLEHQLRARVTGRPCLSSAAARGICCSALQAGYSLRLLSCPEHEHGLGAARSWINPLLSRCQCQRTQRHTPRQEHKLLAGPCLMPTQQRRAMLEGPNDLTCQICVHLPAQIAGLS